jgi:hypothetical protein
MEYNSVRALVKKLDALGKRLVLKLNQIHNSVKNKESTLREGFPCVFTSMF